MTSDQIKAELRRSACGGTGVNFIAWVAATDYLLPDESTYRKPEDVIDIFFLLVAEAL